MQQSDTAEIETVRIDTTLTPKSFTAFSHFNAFYMNGRGLALALFPIAMIAMGFVHRLTGSEILFRLFLGSGIVIPLAYLLFYFVALRGQIKANKLSEPRFFYSVSLDGSGISVRNERESVVYEWNRVYRVYETDEYAYLYMTKTRAFILPYANIVSGDVERLDAALRAKLETSRIVRFGKRKTRR